MRAALFLLLALGAASASACTLFEYCHCLDSDGSANDGATRAACNIVGGNTQNDPTNKFQESYDSASTGNVQFKQYCWNSGATGDNESCRVHPGGK